MSIRFLILFIILSFWSSNSFGSESVSQNNLNIYSSDSYVYAVYSTSFSECVGSKIKAQKRGSSRAQELEKFISDALLEKIIPASGSPDKILQLEASVSLMMDVNYFLGMPCPLPPSKAEILALVSTLRPFLEEAERVKRCAFDQAGESVAYSGDDLFSPLEQGDNSSLYKNILIANINSFVKFSPASRHDLGGGSIADGLNNFANLAGDPFNIQVVARQQALYSIFADISLNSRCNPSVDLYNFVGMPKRNN